MVRSKFIKSVFSALTATGLALGQQTTPPALPANAAGRTVIVTEAGKACKCTVLKVWNLTDGSWAMQVEAIDTGEKMTIVNATPSSKDEHSRTLAARIFHWGRGNTTAPAGVPVPPGQSVETTTSCVPCEKTPAKKTVVLSDKDKSLPVIVTLTKPLTPESNKTTRIFSAPGGHCVTTGTDDPSLPVVENQKQKTIHYPRTAWNQTITPAMVVAAPAPPQPSIVQSAAPTAQPDQPTPAPTTTHVETQPARGSNWRESWGILKNHSKDSDTAKEDKKTSTTVKKEKTTTEHKVTTSAKGTPAEKTPVDPLMNPEPYSRVSVDDKIAKKMKELKIADDKTQPSKAKEITQVLDPVPTIVKAEKPRTPAEPLMTRKPVEPTVSIADRAPDPLPQTPETYDPLPVSAGKEIVPVSTQPVVSPENGDSVAVPTTPVPVPASKSGLFAKIRNKDAATQAAEERFNAFSAAEKPNQGVRKINAFTPGAPLDPYAQPASVKPEGTADKNSQIEVSYPQSPYAKLAENPRAAEQLATRRPAMIQQAIQGQPTVIDRADYQPATTDEKDSIHQWLGVLKNSLYPSQREWAAEQLAVCDWHVHQDVVQDLLKAAKGDPAATVRAGCIRCLGRMNVNTVPVVLAIQALRSDSDVRVQSEIDEALKILAPDLQLPKEKPVPASQDEMPEGE